jgi:hypothetical protein
MRIGRSIAFELSYTSNKNSGDGNTVPGEAPQVLVAYAGVAAFRRGRHPFSPQRAHRCAGNPAKFGVALIAGLACSLG